MSKCNVICRIRASARRYDCGLNIIRGAEFFFITKSDANGVLSITKTKVTCPGKNIELYFLDLFLISHRAVREHQKCKRAATQPYKPTGGWVADTWACP